METSIVNSSQLTAEEINVLEQFYSAFSNKNPAIADIVLTETWEDIPLPPGQSNGAKGFKELVQYFTTSFPDVSVKVLEIFGANQKAAVRAEMSFTHSAELFGIPATNKKVTIALHEFHYLENNKIAKTWHLEDWMSMIFQLGIQLK